MIKLNLDLIKIFIKSYTVFENFLYADYKKNFVRRLLKILYTQIIKNFVYADY